MFWPAGERDARLQTGPMARRTYHAGLEAGVLLHRRPATAADTRHPHCKVGIPALTASSRSGKRSGRSPHGEWRCANGEMLDASASAPPNNQNRFWDFSTALFRAVGPVQDLFMKPGSRFKPITWRSLSWKSGQPATRLNDSAH